MDKPRTWTYEEKIRLRVGMRFGLLETEALALEGDTIEELEAHAFRMRAERKDGLEADLQRKLAKQDLDEQASPPSLRSGSVSPGVDKPDPLMAALARKVGARLM